jgi:hypothetical protein
LHDKDDLSSAHNFDKRFKHSRAMLSFEAMTYWGLLKRKEIWMLSWRGRLLLLFATIAALVVIARHIHPFLALNQPVHGEILVVEGWMTDSILEQAVSFFNKYDYQLIVTTGVPLEQGSHLSEYSTFAELTAATLRQIGVGQSLIVSIPAPPVRTDRTFASALAVSKWLSQSGMPINSVDVFSVGTHARRTQWLFQSALGDDIAVGVIAAPNPEYDGDRWWAWSSGVRAVVCEAIAYIYARFLSSPYEREVAPDS